MRNVAVRARDVPAMTYLKGKKHIIHSEQQLTEIILIEREQITKRKWMSITMKQKSITTLLRNECQYLAYQAVIVVVWWHNVRRRQKGRIKKVVGGTKDDI